MLSLWKWGHTHVTCLFALFFLRPRERPPVVKPCWFVNDFATTIKSFYILYLVVLKCWGNILVSVTRCCISDSGTNMQQTIWQGTWLSCECKALKMTLSYHILQIKCCLHSRSLNELYYSRNQIKLEAKWQKQTHKQKLCLDSGGKELCGCHVAPPDPPPPYPIPQHTFSPYPSPVWFGHMHLQVNKNLTRRHCWFCSEVIVFGDSHKRALCCADNRPSPSTHSQKQVDMIRTSDSHCWAEQSSHCTQHDKYGCGLFYNSYSSVQKWVSIK